MRRDRAVSTVLDVSLALVLVSAAVLVLARAPATPTDDVGTDGADDAADVLAGTTADLSYTLAPAARTAGDHLVEFPEGAESGPGFRRESHGTLAEHLAAAAVGNATVDDRPVTNASADYRRRVRNATLSAVGDRGGVQIRAVWRPFPGSDVGGRVVVGDRPPLTARVHAATLNVTSELPAARDRAIAAAERVTDGKGEDEGGDAATPGRDGYRAVARVVANATVRGLFPPERTRVAVHGTYPTSALVTYRYLRLARLTGADLPPKLIVGNATAANERLVAALTDRFADRLREQYPTPRAAATNVTVGRVTITVRRWSG